MFDKFTEKKLRYQMNPDNPKDINKQLFTCALGFLDAEEVKSNAIEKISNLYGLKEILNIYINPKEEPARNEKFEKMQKAREMAKKATIDYNEKEFGSKSEAEILASYNHLYWIANALYIEGSSHKENITENTLSKLKNILKKLIYNPLKEEHTSLLSLAKFAPNARRYIDMVYYVSAQLQDDEVKWDLIDPEILKYLYINCLTKENVGNIIKGAFLKKIESEKIELVVLTLKEFIKMVLVCRSSSNTKKIISKYFKNEKSLEKLKTLSLFHKDDEKDLQNEVVANFLSAYSFEIKIDDLRKLLDQNIDENNKKNIQSFIYLHDKELKKSDINNAICLYGFVSYGKLEELDDSNIKVDILNFMMHHFNTEESIEHVNGFQSGKSLAASFLSRDALRLLTIDELKKLNQARSYEDDLWGTRISHEISQREHEATDKDFVKYSIDKIKNFLLTKTVLNGKDFSEDVFIKLCLLKNEIQNVQNGRNNDKDDFFNGKQSKNEELCRDVILRRLRDKYSRDLILTKELNEGNNRVDINIKYKAKPEFEVQVECKKDNNPSLFSGLKEQLIYKYMCDSTSTETNKYGIYLVFYFEEQKVSVKETQEKLEKEIPDAYKNNIKVIIFDLRKPAKTTRKSSGTKPSCMSQNKSKHTILSKRKKDAGNN